MESGAWRAISPWGCQESDVTEHTLMHTEIKCLSLYKYRPDLCPVAHTEDIGLGKVWEMVKDRETWCAVVHGVIKSWTGLNNNSD